MYRFLISRLFLNVQNIWDQFLFTLFQSWLIRFVPLRVFHVPDQHLQFIDSEGTFCDMSDPLHPRVVNHFILFWDVGYLWSIKNWFRSLWQPFSKPGNDLWPFCFPLTPSLFSLVHQLCSEFPKFLSRKKLIYFNLSLKSEDLKL